MKPIIAIDGYSSTGKSSYAKMLAKEFGWIHIDTGAMYRAVTLYAIENFYKNNTIDELALLTHLNDIHLDFKLNSDSNTNEIYLNEKNVENRIRAFDISEHVSWVAKIPEVREYLVKQQRNIGKNGGIVMDGRDIGTVVFPNADLKFFITASIEERAKRRFTEYKNQHKNISLEEVQENLKQRDYIDGSRSVSPLTQAADAILIDNTHLSKAETYNKMVQIVKDKFQI
ncbi:(d)CMP kinase [Apibacter sp. B3924]|nr:(d)CMP kinase [Apibacter sp. B3924]MXO26190.1 (d)CMP kinase [Apibacter sp. B3813]MXO28141.1 (d)CMP kinase [Apibacter sp. B3913]MXO30095.1 (d)CMP kinase [Apibacter sp. B3912]MXP01854.1 (d)CMP kinase [Apibacter sp. B3918]